MLNIYNIFKYATKNDVRHKKTLQKIYSIKYKVEVKKNLHGRLFFQAFLW